jgi:chorismate mutase
MQEIEKIRSEIDEIHVELARLFRQRLVLAQKIWELKKDQNISYLDSNRESKIIYKFDAVISQNEEKEAVQNFFKCILLETKKYLEVRLK